MPHPLITITNASVSFNNEITLNNFYFTLNERDHLAITGPDFSGKSTLLKCLAGKQMLSSGTIQRPFVDEYIKNHKVEDPFFSFHQLTAFLDVRHSFKNLQNLKGHFYQQRYNASFSGDSLTTEEYLNEAASKSQWNGFWDFKKVVDLLNLDSLLSKHLIKLSNGESRRVRLGEALIKNPLILFLNQPLVGIDVETRIKFNSIFKAISDSKITLVIACHENEIPSIFNKVVKMQKSKTPLIYDRANFQHAEIKTETKIISHLDKIPLLLKDHPKYAEIVTMKNVTVKYSQQPILKNINWTIKQGERWSLSGPNGSGKSTLLSLINGDHPQAYANDIILFDKKRGSGESIWDIKKNIGFISPELFQFFPANITCKKAISSGFFDTIGFFKKINVDQEKSVMQWIDLFNLSEYANRPLRNLPITMQRLTLLARALVKNPVLLILDEPCQGFGLSQQIHFKNVLDALSQQNNITWIYVTHHQEQLPDSVTHKLVLNENGEILYHGYK
ncbi:MAG TPA: ATP-binding cassette domain-containing protein [Marinilabiliaceae bacterium]|nr:ATP-binding cassette domain-containing protein [Marinilabiliaceae bacterium]